MDIRVSYSSREVTVIKSIMRIMRKTYYPTMCLVLMCLFFILYVNVCLVSNVDLSAARYMLHMDEMITLDQVMDIFHSHSFKDIIKNIVGNDQRYGRPLVYLSSLFALPAWIVGGEQSIIISIRMTQVLALGIGYYILACSLINSKTLRLLAFVTMAALPNTAYFSSVPKPEPFQMLFLSLFFWFFFKKKRILGCSWILLGIAYGMKISILPLIPVLFVFVWCSLSLVHWKSRFLVLLVNSAPYFVLGFFLAVPCIIYKSNGWAEYLQSTFFGLGHGSDSDQINFFSWAGYVLNGSFSYSRTSSALIIIGIFLLMVIVLISAIKTFIKNRRRGMTFVLGLIVESLYASGLVVLLCGLILVLSVMLNVKRLSGWGYYIHVGQCLIFVGVFSIAEYLMREQKLLYRNAAIVVVLGIAANLTWALPEALRKHKVWASRTSKQEFVLGNIIYKQVETMTKQDAARVGRRIRVGIDPLLFNPSNDETRQFFRYWGEFDQWNAEYDTVIAQNCKIFKQKDSTASASCNYHESVLDHLSVGVQGSCKSRPCYVPREVGVESIVYLVRQDSQPLVHDLEKHEFSPSSGK
ncbi:ABC-2 type transport system permease protein [Azospirillaceae bacterium]